MSTLETIFATEEEVVLRAPADFSSLCPFDQLLAAGMDGEFYPADRWTLRSASVDFAAQGVAAGQLVRLRVPTGALPGEGELFVVVDTSNGGVTLRRPGQAAVVGQPPAPAGGLQGVEFFVATLQPQLIHSSQEVARRLGLFDAAIASQTLGSDRVLFRDLTVVDALRALYDAAAGGLGPSDDTFAARANRYRQEFEERLSQLITICNRAGMGADHFLARYQTRLSR